MRPHTYTYNEIKNMKPSALCKSKVARHGLIDDGKREGYCDHPFMMEDITLYSYDKHDLCQWISTEGLAGIEVMKTALSDEARASVAQRIHDRWYPDDEDGHVKVSAYTDQIVMGHIDGFRDIVDTIDSKTFKEVKDLLFGCNLLYVWAKNGEFAGDFGRLMLFDRNGTRMAGRKRFLDLWGANQPHHALLTIPDVQGFRFHNDDVGGYAGEERVDFLREDSIAIEDEGKFHGYNIYTTSCSAPIPNIISVAYELIITDEVTGEGGRYGTYEIWTVDKECIDKAEKYFAENHPDLPSYREY